VGATAKRTKLRKQKDQSARFVEAAKAAGADQKAFERAFNKIVKPKSAKRTRAK
jgi:hypothetical protein